MCYVNYFMVCILFLCGNIANALQSDRAQPITATSDRAELFSETHTGIYKDHVVADQGSTQLTADQVIVQLDAHNQLDNIVALGAPAHFLTVPKVNDKPAIAYAKRIEYYPQKNKVVLIGDASVVQAEDTYNAEKIYYDTVTEEVQTPKQVGHQVTIVIKPKPKEMTK